MLGWCDGPRSRDFTSTDFRFFSDYFGRERIALDTHLPKFNIHIFGRKTTLSKFSNTPKIRFLMMNLDFVQWGPKRNVDVKKNRRKSDIVEMRREKKNEIRTSEIFWLLEILLRSFCAPDIDDWYVGTYLSKAIRFWTK